MHSEDHFSEEGLFGSRFSKSSFKFTGSGKVEVPSRALVNKLCNKNYANLWFILLQVTKGFRFQKKKMFVSFLATFHLRDFLKSENNTMWSIYFNQQTLTASLFRIYHIERHLTIGL